MLLTAPNSAVTAGTDDGASARLPRTGGASDDEDDADGDDEEDLQEVSRRRTNELGNLRRTNSATRGSLEALHEDGLASSHSGLLEPTQRRQRGTPRSLRRCRRCMTRSHGLRLHEAQVGRRRQAEVGDQDDSGQRRRIKQRRENSEHRERAGDDQHQPVDDAPIDLRDSVDHGANQL